MVKIKKHFSLQVPNNFRVAYYYDITYFVQIFIQEINEKKKKKKHKIGIHQNNIREINNNIYPRVYYYVYTQLRVYDILQFFLYFCIMLFCKMCRNAQIV